MKPVTILACAALLAPAPAAAQTLSAPSDDLLQPTARQYTLAELNHIEAIKRLKARYFRMLDTKNWQEWGKIFAPDAVLRVSGDNSITGCSRGPAEIMEIVGRDNIVERVSRTTPRP